MECISEVEQMMIKVEQLEKETAVTALLLHIGWDKLLSLLSSPSSALFTIQPRPRQNTFIITVNQPLLLLYSHYKIKFIYNH
jgi:hypothetical protein